MSLVVRLAPAVVVLAGCPIFSSSTPVGCSCRSNGSSRNCWAFLFRMIMGLALAGALLAPAAGLAAGPYVAKAATEETDWISPVYDLLEEEGKGQIMVKPLSELRKLNGTEKEESK